MPRNRNTIITQKEIARQLNLSQGAISHVLNGRDHFLHPETARRIRIALEEMNYRPDRVARSLRSRRSGIIGVILPNLRHPIFVDKIRGVHRLAHENGYHVMMGDAEDSIANEQKFIEEFVSFRAEGLIVMGLFSPPREHVQHLKAAIESGMPVVTIDCPVGLHCPQVNVDIASGMEAAMTHLFTLGHRNIAFAAHGRHVESGKLRWEGIKRACGAFDLSVPSDDHVYPPRSGSGHRPFATGYELAEEILKRRATQFAKKRYTAIVCMNDLIALGVVRRVADQNLSVPGDISVVGFDGFDIGNYSSPRLTTVDQPKEEIGKMAFEILLRLIREGPNRSESIQRTLQPTLVVRDSTGPVA